MGAFEDIEGGFIKGLKPQLTDEGTSGTYILRGPDRKPRGIFKPIDEEQFAPNNPRDFKGNFGDATFRAGVLSGEATVRELAAYLLDSEHFSSVPPTTLVAVTHETFNTNSVQTPDLLHPEKGIGLLSRPVDC